MSFLHTRTTGLSALTLFCVAMAWPLNANAVDGKLLTCAQMETNCLLTAKRAEAEAKANNRLVAPNMTAAFCYDSYHAAQNSGVWPANPPFNFALKCTR